MNQRREKEGVVIPTFDMHIYTTHMTKVGNGSDKRKKGVVILVICTFDMHIYTTHMLSWEWIREEKKREWLFLRLTCTSTQLTS